MPDTQTLINNVLALATRMGTECKTLHGETAANSSSITSLRTELLGAIDTAKAAVKSEVLGGASAAYDTLKEIEDLLKSNDSIVAALQALKCVHSDSQSLTSGEQTQARSNIGAAADADVVKIVSQTLDSTAQAQARSNIGAASAADVSGLGSGAVRHDQAQTLSDSAKTQARTNIGAASAADLTALSTAIGDLTNIDFVDAFETALEDTTSSGE